MFRKILIATSLLFLGCLYSFSQNESKQDTIFVVDTLVVFDTVNVAKKKIVEDSIQAKQNNQADTTVISKKRKQIIPSNFGIQTADYAQIGGYFRLKFNKIFGLLCLGYNFHPESPLSLGTGIGYRFDLSKSLKFNPNIYSVLYMPLSLNYGNTRRSHLRLGFSYLFSSKLALIFEPSIYISSVDNTSDHNMALESSSFLKPISRSTSSSNIFFDFGAGLSIGIEFITN